MNEVTREMFKKYKTPEDYVILGAENLEREIYSLGFYRNKSKNIIGACMELMKLKEMPQTVEGLMKLPGVGKKTANVVASNAFGVPAIAVDTHVFRVSNRIGLAKAKDVVKTEAQLEKNIPKDMWIKAHHMLIFHGRNLCTARSPKCEICPVNKYCNYYEEK